MDLRHISKVTVLRIALIFFIVVGVFFYLGSEPAAPPKMNPDLPLPEVLTTRGALKAEVAHLSRARFLSAIEQAEITVAYQRQLLKRMKRQLRHLVVDENSMMAHQKPTIASQDFDEKSRQVQTILVHSQNLVSEAERNLEVIKAEFLATFPGEVSTTLR